ncbi:MAG: Hypothetical protein AJITA_00552 [Acetilactobacillus jinshanensis]
MMLVMLAANSAAKSANVATSASNALSVATDPASISNTDANDINIQRLFRCNAVLILKLNSEATKASC